MAQGIVDVHQGFLDVQKGIADVRQGIVDVEQGIADVEEGIVDVQKGIADVDRSIGLQLSGDREALGYVPSTRSSLVCSRASSSALRTGSVAAWPSMSR